MRKNEKKNATNISEPFQEKKKRLNKIVRALEKEYPEAGITLNYENDFQLLAAVILSAQCTDERVNAVTKKLFREYKTAKDFAGASIKTIEKAVYSTGFYRAKAKNIVESARIITEKYGGKVPSTMKELLTLPGVGRKTANVVLGHISKPEGIVVDTHVIRISNKLGLVDSKNPAAIEKELIKLVPKSKWTMFTHYVIAHGRKICKARSPQCDKCAIAKLCPSRK